ncbi:MAG TPA: cupredoxin domain-containing protein [Candidatus Saccharimonadales bacterium]|nr:cupredoxin domain-containing protein [Candidatus Saccharimonadales bacterium]
MNRKTVAAVVVALVVLAIGGVWLLMRNSSNNSSSMNMNSASTQQNNKAVATHSVTIQDFAFSPAHITVKKGTTVIWTNRDSTAHTVTQDSSSTGGPKLDSQDLVQGDLYEATFTTAGTFTYHCSIHPNMTGTVTVTE